MLKNDLYLSKGLVSCYEGEGDDDAAAAAAAAAAAGDPPAKTFTQEEVNRILADDKRKHQAALLKTETTYKDMLASNQSLTAKERATLEENLQMVQGQLRTKEEQAKMERKQLEEELSGKIKSANDKAVEWEGRYKNETVARSLQDAAVSADAFNPSQIVTILKPWTKLVEDIDEKSGKSTGRFKSVVEFPDVDSEGQPTISTRTPADAVKRMKDLPETYGNLFKSNVVSGIGSNSTTGSTPGNGKKLDLSKLTTEQYRELRKTNPGALGLSASHTQRNR